MNFKRSSLNSVKFTRFVTCVQDHLQGFVLNHYATKGIHASSAKTGREIVKLAVVLSLMTPFTLEYIAD